MNVKKKSSTALSHRSADASPRRALMPRWGHALVMQGVLASLAVTANAQTLRSDDTPRYPTAALPAALPSGATNSSADVFVATAPDTYIVVRGDTLWGIAGRFLKQPWRWPEIWQVNRDQIRNPHWIFPGQAIVLDRATGTMRLGADANGTVKLTPQIRSQQSGEAIPSIPPEAIEPYLSQPLIVESKTMRDAPRIVASKERVVLGAGDIAYVSGIVDPDVRNYQIFRPGRPLNDPDTGDLLAYQADYLGSAEVTRPGDPTTVAITTSKMEITAGDRLLPASKPGVTNYMPHAPERPVAGRVAAVYSGVAFAGPSMIVAINRGASDGLDIGTVLAIKTFGRTITDRTNGSRERITLPEERKGLLFVFRVFDHVAYGLITSASDVVQVGDSVSQP